MDPEAFILLRENNQRVWDLFCLLIFALHTRLINAATVSFLGGHLGAEATTLPCLTTNFWYSSMISQCSSVLHTHTHTHFN